MNTLDKQTQKGAAMNRLEKAKVYLAELRKDAHSKHVAPRHLWELAYWKARNT